MRSNESMRKAFMAKNNEYYTRYEDVEEEISNYGEFLKGKVVYCPCDTMESAFYQYFVNNFNRLQLKKLIVSSIYDKTVIFNGDTKTYIHERVDFLSDTADFYYEQADVVITNPPFSLFRKFYTKIKSFKKEFIILGSNQGCSYKNVFLDFMNNTCRHGFTKSRSMWFQVPDSYELKKGDKIIDGKKHAHIPVSWYTSFPINHGRKLIFTATYDPDKYIKYENYDAIDVNRLKDIPMDYSGIMGVPCSYLSYHNPDEFKIIGLSHGLSGKECGVRRIPDEYSNNGRHRHDVYYLKDGKAVAPFTRIFIQKIKR